MTSMVHDQHGCTEHAARYRPHAILALALVLTSFLHLISRRPVVFLLIHVGIFHQGDFVLCVLQHAS
ncbi:hypothetical protein J6590_042893 [Homalodisca vitripennis]|nr:hypothetical protein J6590_042893 [Homalodisca vitripennis]